MYVPASSASPHVTGLPTGRFAPYAKTPPAIAKVRMRDTTSATTDPPHLLTAPRVGRS